MRKLIDFAKIEASGNDFILLDNRTFGDDALTGKQIEKICDRHFGIGADGLIRLDSSGSQFRIKYYNADGSEGAMCGNGLRAAVLFAYIQGLLKKEKELCFFASDGKHRVLFFSKDKICVEILIQSNIIKIAPKNLDLPDELKILGFTNTGVPHLVLETEAELSDIDLMKIGPALRNHPLFQPEGTNVDIICKSKKAQLSIRTYERGVENETLSCGTGVTASALIYWNNYQVDGKQLLFNTKGGQLKVEKKTDGIFLEGPARAVFVGQYLLGKL